MTETGRQERLMSATFDQEDPDYATNPIAVDAESDLFGCYIWQTQPLKAAKDNPNTQFAIIDNGNESQAANFTMLCSRQSLLCCWLH